MESAKPQSDRLAYKAISVDALDAFYELAVDPHINRYLLDGLTMTRDWCRAELDRSEHLFEDEGVGIWLISERRDDQPIGFAGFRVFEEISPELQLLYAFRERATGHGYATECGHALLQDAIETPQVRFDEMLAAVDAPNRASIRVLEKLAFVRAGQQSGAFGDLLLFRWRRARRKGAG